MTAGAREIAGCYECIEPQVSNLFKRETLSGEFLQVNAYLVAELRRRGRWTAAIRERIVRAEGSVQGLDELPADVRAAIRNTWTVEEVDLHSDLADLHRLRPAERHLVNRLVAFFATGDTIVANNLVLNLYRHVNAPEARLYLSRQLFEEAVHVQFYLTLLDTHLPDPAERAQAFAAVDTIASIRAKARFCQRWIDTVHDRDALRDRADRRAFLLNLICFAACIEGLFFYGVFYGAFAGQVRAMLAEAVEVETVFAADLLAGGVAGMTLADMRAYLEHVADRRLVQLGFDPMYGSANPFGFLALQDVQELSNFFERRVSSYQVAVTGTVAFDEDF